MICTWPEEEKKPAIPLTYNSETMHGFEYGVASHMIQEHMTEQAHEIAVSIREKYDGQKRNPYNEFECGSNYARSMASFGLLLAYSGFQYDLTKGMIGFVPVLTSPGTQFFWSVENAWGVFRIADDHAMVLDVLFGTLHLKRFVCSLFAGKNVFWEDKALVKEKEDTVLLACELSEGDSTVLTIQ